MTRALSVVLAALLLALAACDVSRAGPADHPDLANADHPDHATSHHDAGATHGTADHRELDAAEPTDFSIYHVESTFTDQTGTDRPLHSLAGRVRLVAMLYTSCAYACPRIMLDLKRIEGELGPALADDVGFVVISIDPERDTPERLAEFAAGSRLDPDRWTLLTADEGDILEVAALLGVRYRETGPGEWVHSNAITVLDTAGEIVHRQLGLGADPSATLAVIPGLLE